MVDAATLARIADNGWDRDVTERCIVLSNHPERLRRGIAAVQAFRQDLRNPSLLTGRETITFLVAAVGLLLLIFRGTHSWVGLTVFMVCSVALIGSTRQIMMMRLRRLHEGLECALFEVRRDLSWVPKSDLENLLHATASSSHWWMSDESVTAFLEQPSPERDAWVSAYHDVVYEGGGLVLSPRHHGGARPEQLQEYRLRRGIVDQLISASARA
ncbi:hypothetical protein [Dermacoccus sp. Tok2021]|uniref:hypothetical protein n=1 Tax=Dermacoccus sp. Tok2021 TaxID=2826873 RepID=UPI001CA61528|nr:hypothetical protein [Dermacoccus sp. Tok2021]MBZ4497961.1 hypothetical protein [Dermacoccus sp. Tok2021]